MSACSHPSVETILRCCIVTLRVEILPELKSEWARFSGALLVGSLEYALELMEHNRPDRHWREVVKALEVLQPEVAVNGDAELASMFDATSPYETASRLLAYACLTPSKLSDYIRAVLHPVLLRQLDEDLASAAPLLNSFTRKVGDEDEA